MPGTCPKPRGDHPRIRGEHGVEEELDIVVQGSSPHTRGARGAPPDVAAVLRIIPAYAGSTGPAGTPPSETPDHPRIRGEHLCTVPSPSRRSGSSPHTRGAQHLRFRVRLAGRIIPAYAGSTPSCSGVSSSGWDHPRIRGEHFDSSCQLFLPGGSSPHTRGALIMKDSISKSVRIIPAYAGSTSMSTMTGVRITDHPRIRGEHDDKRRAGQPRSGIIPAYAGSTGQHTPSHRPASGSSPHTRGAPVKPLRGGVAHRIIPAYAGSTRAPPSASTRLRDHPRIRGEHLAKSLTEKLGGGSSPHTRGALDCRPEGRVLMGIIPAYAGSTPPAPKSRNTGRDHPRIRGEHVDGWEGAGWARGSSPHTRGARGESGQDDSHGRIIPAYAGSTSDRSATAGSGGDHPRIRGEHTDPLPETAPYDGSSPHTRGALRRRTRRCWPRRIIPAYAGSTSRSWTGTPTSWDHPRIRGEHSRRIRARREAKGSSPHTRGAPDDKDMGKARERIIPAYAGSTGSRPPTAAAPTDHPRIRGEHW